MKLIGRHVCGGASFCLPAFGIPLFSHIDLCTITVVHCSFEKQSTGITAWLTGLPESDGQNLPKGSVDLQLLAAWPCGLRLCGAWPGE